MTNLLLKPEEGKEEVSLVENRSKRSSVAHRIDVGDLKEKNIVMLH